ncbi:hypothetical protein JGU66_22580 [Myxococcaceae bacterium JPH2]|nr:hypothetical protein [Myxococcaceae bacterium JPH2]
MSDEEDEARRSEDVRAMGDPDKMAVIACIGQLVLDGAAVWDLLEDGDVGVRLASGEVYLLQGRVVLRIA